MFCFTELLKCPHQSTWEKIDQGLINPADLPIISFDEHIKRYQSDIPANEHKINGQNQRLVGQPEIPINGHKINDQIQGLVDQIAIREEYHEKLMQLGHKAKTQTIKSIISDEKIYLDMQLKELNPHSHPHSLVQPSQPHKDCDHSLKIVKHKSDIINIIPSKPKQNEKILKQNQQQPQSFPKNNVIDDFDSLFMD